MKLEGHISDSQRAKQENCQNRDFLAFAYLQAQQYRSRNRKNEAINKQIRDLVTKQESNGALAVRSLTEHIPVCVNGIAAEYDEKGHSKEPDHTRDHGT